jgi:iron complex transport system substrate-binding protein
MKSAWLAPLALALCVACGGERTKRGTSHTGTWRVVSLHDVTSEVVIALSGQDRLVGVAEPVDLSPDHRAALAHVPRADGLESILALRPHVVLGLDVVEEKDPELVRTLRAAGIDVYLPNPVTVADVEALARGVATRIGAATAGEALVSRFHAQVGEEAQAAPRVRVFVYDCCDPPFTAGGKTVLSDLIRRAGGQNVFADLDTDWTSVSWEEAIVRKPELIVIHAYQMDGQGDVAEKQRALARMPSLRDVPSVVLPLRFSLGGLGSAEGLARLRAALSGRGS